MYSICAAHLVVHVRTRHARAHDLVLRWRFEWCDIGVRSRRGSATRIEADRLELAIERLIAQQLAVSHRPPWRALHRHHALGDRQILHRRVQSLRRQTKQHAPRLGGRDTRFHSANAGRAARGSEAVGARERVVADDRDLIEVEIELVGGDLTQRRGSALPEIDVAKINAGGVVRVDREIRIEHRRIGRTRYQPALQRGPGARGCLRLGDVADADAHHDRAADLQKLAPINDRCAVAVVVIAVTHGSPPRRAPVDAVFVVVIAFAAR